MLSYQTKGNKNQKINYVLLNPLPKHFFEIQELCRRVYPFSKPWSVEQLESHRSYFPGGQLIVVEEETQKVVGLAFSLIVDWNDYSPQDNWQDFTSGGFFHNHNPKKGKTLYGAEVMVDPECRGKGIGKLLYEGRKQIVEDYDLKRIRAGARLRGYSKYKDQYEPEEYVRKVVQKKIYDPTLSFQLGRDFQVIDVASNYLFNDPESLGFAAVIEWLNPKNSTERELKKHDHAVEMFLQGNKFIPEFLPKELRRLVRKSSTVLGKAILENEGRKFFRKIERYREQLKLIRNNKDKSENLQKLYLKLSKEDSSELQKIAHAFSLQLEVVNVCEAAYRTWRQRQKSPSLGVKSNVNLTYVLTAHPTEARSKSTVSTLADLQKILVEGIQNNFYFNDLGLATGMRKLWIQPLFKKQKPSVQDEADYIFSLIFSREIFDYVLQEKRGYDIKLRTWVGGDKDGHPGVNSQVMKDCLGKSRAYILSSSVSKLDFVINDISELVDSNKQLKSELEQLKTLTLELKKFQQLVFGDGTKLKTWKMKYTKFLKKSSLFVKEHEQIKLLNKTFEVFPALVVPIELREDASVIKSAIKDPKLPISGMLSDLSRIAGALDLTYYGRGLVISHCETSEDLTAACTLIEASCKRPRLPVIPLFESESALKNSRRILKNWLDAPKNYERVERHWNKGLEVMLGYSDSAKQSGVLPSRLMIAKTMETLDRFFKSYGIKATFFHGSGGSVARGGGSLKEQISWWSYQAIERPKLTVQGEMIQRLFASKEILNSQCAHLTNESLRRKVRSSKLEKSQALVTLSKYVGDEYSKFVSNGELLAKVLSVTPYKYLDILKIGSRPSKRPSDVPSLDSLRAIPWVMCWTQSRILLPSWWGVGTAWKKLSNEEKVELKNLCERDAFFSSFIKTLGFTLAKVELDIWKMYLKKNNLGEISKTFESEYLKSVKFVKEVSGKKQLIWYRPWLEESIKLRSTHINLLNLIQILAMQKNNEQLLRETIVGIACGMLTTG